MTPSLAELAVKGTRTSLSTLRAFGQRVPGAGGVLAHSLEDAVENRTVMITGASSGIGKAAALKGGEAGGTVLLVARTYERLDETRQQIERRGGVAHVYPCDL